MNQKPTLNSHHIIKSINQKQSILFQNNLDYHGKFIYLQKIQSFAKIDHYKCCLVALN